MASKLRNPTGDFPRTSCLADVVKAAVDHRMETTHADLLKRLTLADTRHTETLERLTSTETRLLQTESLHTAAQNTHRDTLALLQKLEDRVAALADDCTILTSIITSPPN